MRLPAHLLHQLSAGLRVGVGVGAVLLAGCDLVDEVKAAVGGESEAVAVAEPAGEDADAPAPKPGGLAGKVAQAIDEAQPKPHPEPRLEPLLDLPKAPERETSSPAEPEDVTAFVPFGEPSGRTPTRIKPRSKARPIERPLAIAPDEPCDPAVSPVLGSAPPDRDPCPACGRG
jgi:hypothetical protein